MLCSQEIVNYLYAVHFRHSAQLANIPPLKKETLTQAAKLG